MRVKVWVEVVLDTELEPNYNEDHIDFLLADDFGTYRKISDELRSMVIHWVDNKEGTIENFEGFKILMMRELKENHVTL